VWRQNLSLSDPEVEQEGRCECEFTQPALRLDTVVGVPRAAVECLTWISDEVCLDGQGSEGRVRGWHLSVDAGVAVGRDRMRYGAHKPGPKEPHGPHQGGLTDGTHPGQLAASVPVVHAEDVRPAEASDRPVVVIGGGLQGCDAALRLADAGATDIVVLERGPTLVAGDEAVYDTDGTQLNLPSSAH